MDVNKKYIKLHLRKNNINDKNLKFTHVQISLDDDLKISFCDKPYILKTHNQKKAFLLFYNTPSKNNYLAQKKFIDALMNDSFNLSHNLDTYTYCYIGKRYVFNPIRYSYVTHKVNNDYIYSKEGFLYLIYPNNRYFKTVIEN